MAEDQSAVQLDNALIKQLVSSVQTLQSDLAALKSGATGGSNLIQPPAGAATLSQTDSIVSGSSKDPPAKRKHSLCQHRGVAYIYYKTPSDNSAT